MKKKKRILLKVVSFVVMLTMTVGVVATPTGFLASALSDLSRALGSDFSSALGKT